jgi:hypothetical protein
MPPKLSAILFRADHPWASQPGRAQTYAEKYFNWLRDVTL